MTQLDTMSGTSFSAGIGLQSSLARSTRSLLANLAFRPRTKTAKEKRPPGSPEPPAQPPGQSLLKPRPEPPLESLFLPCSVPPCKPPLETPVRCLDFTSPNSSLPDVAPTLGFLALFHAASHPQTYPIASCEFLENPYPIGGPARR